MKKPDAVPDRIRVPAVLAHYPIHHLSRKAAGLIEVREVSASGDLAVCWRVEHDGGPLAYQIDTLIVNRRLDEAPRPIPRIIRLGTLREIARELGLEDGDTSAIREAIMQNAKAFIHAKIKVRCADGSERWMEIGGTRYSVILTGQKLPDGNKADGVYLVLNDPFRDLLDQAQTRPLDYDYLRALPVVAQRLYALLSHAMYAALKQGQGPARLTYSEFCMLAPQARHNTLWRARQQMDRLHAAHQQAGYIGTVTYESTTDRAGRPDWRLLYEPGARAWSEFRAFSRRPAAAAQRPLPLELAEPPAPAAEPVLTLDPLAGELARRGVTPRTAAELVRDFPEARIRAHLAAFDWLVGQKARSVAQNAPGYLVESIRQDYAPPAGLVAAAKRAERTQAEEARTAAARAQRARAEAEEAQVAAYWAGLSAAERAALEAEALEQATPEVREQCASGRPRFVQALRQKACEEQIRRRLGLPVPS